MQRKTMDMIYNVVEDKDKLIKAMRDFIARQKNMDSNPVQSYGAYEEEPYIFNEL